jgi:putative tricarboxylic transport membrane protein
MRVNDLVSGALIILLAVAMIAYTTTFPPFPGQKFGPSLFPRIIGAGMILCGALLLLRGARALSTGQRMGEIGAEYRTRQGWTGVAMIVGGIGFYIALSGVLGFVITAFIVTATLLWHFETPPLKAVVIALVAVLAFDWFFGWMFRVPLPLGILPNGPANLFMNFIRGAR